MNTIRNISIVAGFIGVTVISITGCNSDKDPGRIYMPDMTYSRTVEAYSELDSTEFTSQLSRRGGSQIFFNSIPPAGTIKRGEMFPYSLPDDSVGYKMSGTIENPLDSVSAQDMPEVARLWNINCGICHGEKGAANGPLATGGQVGGVANLTLPAYIDMADGTMFHSITYGKGNMGSYASQLNRKQRWMVVKYIRSLQKPDGAATAGAPKADSTATATN